MYFDLGQNTLYPTLRELRRGEAEVSLEPKSFDLLLHLVRNRARVVEKDELVTVVWDGRAISDATLSSTVKAARRALGDSGSEQGMIRTYHGRGFRYVGPVRELRDAEPELSVPNDAAAEIDLTLPTRPSVAVLPFQSFGSEEGRLLAHGMTQDITVGLARTRWLFVSSGASTRRLADIGMDPDALARHLGVRYTLRGSILQVGSRIRVTSALSDAETRSEVWAEAFHRSLDDLFEVQTEIAKRIVGAVDGEIELQERRRAVLRPIGSLDSWSAYHRAIDLLYKYSAECATEAEKLLDHAARLDPSSARVHAARSFLFWQRAYLRPGPETADDLRRAEDAARQSFELDRHDPFGHWSLGRVSLLQGDFDRAIESLANAVQLNPNFANGHNSLAYAKLFSGNGDLGAANIAAARRISPYDPLTFAYMAQLGAMHSLTGEAGKGADWLARAVAEPNCHYHIHAVALWTHELAGRRTEARKHLDELRHRRPGYDREEYFRVCPAGKSQRALIEEAFSRVGL
jgi:TolB-like protein